MLTPTHQVGGGAQEGGISPHGHGLAANLHAPRATKFITWLNNCDICWGGRGPCSKAQKQMVNLYAGVRNRITLGRAMEARVEDFREACILLEWEEGGLECRGGWSVGAWRACVRAGRSPEAEKS